MNHMLHGFADELVKLGGVGGLVAGLGKGVMKYPMLSLSAPMIAASTAQSAARGYTKGRSGVRGQYLKATADSPSRAAYTNYHQLFGHKPTKRDLKRLHGKYREDAFSRGSSTARKKKRT